VFVDTDALGPAAYDSRVGDLVQNVVEASLVVQFVETLVRCGVLPSHIGVISLYRQQVKLINQKLAGRETISEGEGEEEEEDKDMDQAGMGLGGVEVLTADKSQGRDKDCIVVSLVRSNADNQVSLVSFSTEFGELT
jgi:DNA replication ATP-dependent helicase Dna2